MSSPLTAGTLLQGCYRLQGILARGEFGFIYMAVDQTQADQPCTLEEFRPAASNLAILPQLRDYFQAAIADLTQLQHPQILRTRGLIVAAQRLFLVQDDIAASTCREVLNERLAQGQIFSEAEVQQFLAAILPALADLHDRGICHGNLNLDSILLQEADQLPVLSNFGIVRKLAITQQFQSRHPAQSAAWFAAQSHSTPASDLYSLATVVLALLTGQELAEGDDPHQWLNWRKLVSPALARLLRRMLLSQAPRRFSSAQKALLAMRSLADQMSSPEPSIHPIPSPQTAAYIRATALLSPTETPQGSDSLPIDAVPPRNRDGWLRRPATHQSKAITPPQPPLARSPQRDYSLPLLATIFIVLAGLVTWRITHLVPKSVESNPTVAIASLSPSTEAQMPVDLRDRRRQLGIRYSLFTQLVDELFYVKHPDWVQRSLTGAAGEAMKAEWQQMAATVLTRLATLSQSARQDLGNYDRATYDRWLATVRPPLTPKIIEAQADAQFFQLFPEQQGKTPNPRKSGQVWYAIARDTINRQSQKK